MYDTNDKLAGLIGSRICHDLISPIGAVTNGLELLEMAGLPEGPEADLVNQSARSAAARIKYFRLAFGDCSDADADRTVRSSEVSSVLDDVFEHGRTHVHWEVLDDRPRIEVKAALLAIMCVEAGLCGEGIIAASCHGNNWIIRGNGPKLNLNPSLWAPLTERATDESDVTNIAPSAVQFALLPDLLMRLRRSLGVSSGGEELTLRF